MKKNISLLILLLASLVTVNAKASGFFVEPMVTYERGSGEIDFPAPVNSSDSKVRGFGVGARLGGQVWNTIFAGIDARYSMPKLKDESLKQNIESKAWNGGPMIGLQMPTTLGLRFWGSWILAGEIDPDKDKGVDEKFQSGHGFRLGGGIRVAVVSLNIEYQRIKYDETEIQEIGIFTPGYVADDITLKNNSLVMSVSFPINL